MNYFIDWFFCVKNNNNNNNNNNNKLNYELFHFFGIKFKFHVILEELLDAAMRLKLPKG
jgi:hypothetical protein